MPPESWRGCLASKPAISTWERHRRVRSMRSWRAMPATSRPKATLSATVRHGNRLNPCHTVAIRGVLATTPVSASTKRIRPLLGTSSPLTICNNVLLPQPLGPITAVTWRGLMRKLTRWSASTGAPDFALYVKLTSSQAMATPVRVTLYSRKWVGGFQPLRSFFGRGQIEQHVRSYLAAHHAHRLRHEFELSHDRAHVGETIVGVPGPTRSRGHNQDGWHLGGVRDDFDYVWVFLLGRLVEQACGVGVHHCKSYCCRFIGCQVRTRHNPTGELSVGFDIRAGSDDLPDLILFGEEGKRNGDVGSIGPAGPHKFYHVRIGHSGGPVQFCFRIEPCLLRGTPQ